MCFAIAKITNAAKTPLMVSDLFPTFAKEPQ
jgi:hypothetical protein